MKKIFSILMTALLTVAMISCSKDDEEPNNQPNNSDSDVATTLSDNMLIYDGTTYKGESGVSFFDGSLQYALYKNGDNGFQLTGNIEQNAYNRTFDLTQHHTDMMFSVHINVGESLDLQYQNYPQNYWCFLNGESLEGRSCFSKGTATVTVDNGKLTVLVEGTLINGKELKYKAICENAHPHSYPVLTPNSIIVGDSKIDVAPILSRSSDGTFLFGMANVAGSEMNLIIDLPASMVGKTTRLDQMFGPYQYYFNFSSASLSFAQQLNTDNPFAMLNDEELTNPAFTEGMLEFLEETDAYMVTINGVLRNGTNFGVQLRVMKSDIDPMDNQIVLDGKAYWSEIFGNAIDGRYILNIAGHDDEITTMAAVLSITFYFGPEEIGKTFNLTSNTQNGSYALSAFGLDILGLEFVQSYDNGTFSSRFTQSDEFANASLFTRGTVSFSEDEYAITARLKGQLTNGHSVSAQVRIDKSEIQQH